MTEKNVFSDWSPLLIHAFNGSSNAVVTPRNVFKLLLKVCPKYFLINFLFFCYFRLNLDLHHIPGLEYNISIQKSKYESLQTMNLFMFPYSSICPRKRQKLQLHCHSGVKIFEPQQEDDRVRVVVLILSRVWALHPRGSGATRLRIITFYKGQGVNLHTICFYRMSMETLMSV